MGGGCVCGGGGGGQARAGRPCHNLSTLARSLARLAPHLKTQNNTLSRALSLLAEASWWCVVAAQPPLSLGKESVGRHTSPTTTIAVIISHHHRHRGRRGVCVNKDGVWWCVCVCVRRIFLKGLGGNNTHTTRTPHAQGKIQGGENHAQEVGREKRPCAVVSLVCCVHGVQRLPAHLSPPLLQKRVARSQPACARARFPFVVGVCVFGPVLRLDPPLCSPHHPPAVACPFFEVWAPMWGLDERTRIAGSGGEKEGGEALAGSIAGPAFPSGLCWGERQQGGTERQHAKRGLR